MCLLPESPGDFVLEVVDGGPTGFDAGFALRVSTMSLARWSPGSDRRTT
jgi:hypothetical protein